jgi:hypothetical protein
MKWPLYLLFTSVTFSAGITALSRGWNLAPLATAGKSAPAVAQASTESEELPACCERCSHKAKAIAGSPAVSSVTTNNAGEREIILPCCAGKKNRDN